MKRTEYVYYLPHVDDILISLVPPDWVKGLIKRAKKMKAQIVPPIYLGVL
jgi:hypothetical protein